MRDVQFSTRTVITPESLFALPFKSCWPGTAECKKRNLGRGGVVVPLPMSRVNRGGSRVWVPDPGIQVSVHLKGFSGYKLPL